MDNEVLVINGVGGTGVSIARRVGAGRTIVLADIDAAGLAATASALTGDGHQVLTREVDVTSRSSVAAVAEAAQSAGRVTAVVGQYTGRGAVEPRGMRGHHQQSDGLSIR